MKRILASGNYAATLAAIMSRVEFVAAYPITPQTEVVERFADFVYKRESPLKDSAPYFNPIGYIQSVGEFDAFAACIGAALLGKRSFTATSSQGGTFAEEIFYQASWSRVPIVAAFPTRCRNTWSIWPSLFDFLARRDTDWLQVYCKTPQEIFDRIIQAYNISENKKVLLPTLVGYDGFVTSFTMEPLDLPEQEEVDDFLPPYKFRHIHPFSEDLKGIFSIYSAPLYTMIRREQREALKSSLKVIENVQRKFGKKFGRKYDLLTSYNEDAKILLLGMGAPMGTASKIIERYDGKVGLIDLSWFRPFPTEKIRKICEGAKVLPCVVGEGGMDISAKDIDKIVKISEKFLEGGKADRVVAIMGDSGDILYREVKASIQDKDEKIEWIGLEKRQYEIDPGISGKEARRNVSKGVSSCAGCGQVLATQYIIEVLKDRYPILCVPAGCSTIWGAGMVGIDENRLQNQVLSATLVHTPFAAGPSYATGIARALEISGSKRIAVVLAGDGATFDIGFNNVSGAAERNENFIYVCYDNEAYGNTGMQRSGATPYRAITTTTPTGKEEYKKDMPHIMLAHGIPYLATASIFDIKDLCRKIERAKNIKGFRFIHILTPCPRGWGYDPLKTIEIAKLADKSGIFPRFEWYDNKISIQTERSVEGDEIEKYIKLQGRFRNIKKEDVERLKENVNKRWEVLEHLAKFYG